MSSQKNSIKINKGVGDWRVAINQDRKGAGYFIYQADPIKFDPLAYLRWRNADKVTSQKTVVAEWGRWLQYFRDSPVQRLRQGAATAPSMDSITVTAYLEEKLNAERAVDLLNINNEQLLQTGNAQTQALMGWWDRKDNDKNKSFTCIADPTSARDLAFASALTSSATFRKRPRQASISSQAATESNFQIDSSTFEKELYRVGPVDVGQIFYDFQHIAAKLVNQLTVRVTMKNIHYFLATNYIFDLTAQALQGMSSDTFETIKSRFAVEFMELPDDQAALCVVLGRELARTGRVMPRLLDDPTKMEVLLLFQTLVPKLVRKVMPSDKENEDTFAHTTFDPFWTHVFPRDSDYSFGWANEVDEGSRARRRDGFKPDGYLRKMGACMCIVEIKSPRQAHSDKAFIEDYWKLANFCKDGIDDHLLNGRGIDKMAAVQVFGHQLSIYTMEFKNGIYHWSQLGACYLPMDRTDGSRIFPCLELLRTLERHLNHVEVNCMTPPRNDDRDKVGKPSVLSPSKRPFF